MTAGDGRAQRDRGSEAAGLPAGRLPGGPLSEREAEDGSLRRSLVIIFLARTALNTSHRIIYPFLPSIARGLGISLTAASFLVTSRLVAGLAAPLMGPVAERHRRRRVMETGLLLFVVAGFLLAGSRGFALAIIAFVLFGLSKVIYDPAVHAYLGDTVPYARRGRAVGVVELSWSSAWLVGVPAAGFLIERFGWRAPWAMLGVLGLLGLGLTHLCLPPGRRVAPAEGALRLATLLDSWRDLLRQRQVVILLSIGLLLVIALEVPFIVYGAWLESSFGLSLSALGLASIVVGLAEAAGEFGTTLFTDRLGKRRSVLLGLLCLTASLLLLPWLARLGLAPAMLGVLLVMLCFEFAFVSLIPMASEIAPQARSTLLSFNVTIFSLGRIVGAALGGWLWQWQVGGIGAHVILGAACALAAALLVWRGLDEIGG